MMIVPLKSLWYSTLLFHSEYDDCTFEIPLQARLHAIQVDPRTYLDEPSGSSEMYGMWCEGFDLDDVKGEISELLVSKSEVRGLYTKLVCLELC